MRSIDILHVKDTEELDLDIIRLNLLGLKWTKIPSYRRSNCVYLRIASNSKIIEFLNQTNFLIISNADNAEHVDRILLKP